MTLFLSIDDMIKIQDVRIYAEQHILEMDDMLDVKNNARPAPVQIPEHCCLIESLDLRCCYVEFKASKGLYKLLTVSPKVLGTPISRPTAYGIADLFGLATPYHAEVAMDSEGFEHLELLDLPDQVREEEKLMSRKEARLLQ